MKQISIIGFGRFGQTLYKLLKTDFFITIYNPTEITLEERSNFTKNTKIAENLQEIYTSEVIFFAVPIPIFGKVIKEHKKYFKPHNLLIDVLSVKKYPESIFKKYLKNLRTQAMLTHPMFGPDSSKNGFIDLPIIIDKFKSSNKNYLFWKNYFIEKKLNIIEMSTDQHDKLAANSQGVTHFIGRVLNDFGLKKTPIDSLGAKKLLEIKEQTCNDTWELFIGLQNYNPYTKKMRVNLGKAYDKIYNKLLPKTVNNKYLTFGIQGGKGSNNEEAILNYIKKEDIKKAKIKYLYTTKKVLESLHKGEIDFGQFAISNVKGGLVDESIKAMPGYKFKIVYEFDMLIRHFLMKRKDVELNEIKIIMAHPQNIAQCKENLAKKYSDIEIKIGTGDLLDTSKAAQALSKNKLNKSIAILGPRILADYYNLDIIDENLEDLKDNFTKFFIVKR